MSEKDLLEIDKLMKIEPSDEYKKKIKPSGNIPTLKELMRRG